MFTPDDVRELHRRGISVEEGRRQIELLSGPEPYLELLRPCTVGEGIVRLKAHEFDSLHELHAAAAGEGRLIKFVPASGAASRMFKSLLYFERGPGVGTSWETILGRAQEGDATAAELVAFVEQLERFAFHDDLKRHLARDGQDLGALVREGRYGPILETLLGASAMDCSQTPKGLLKFHHDGSSGRTALEEHLVEAGEYVRDLDGVCRLHFTIGPRQQKRFEAVACLAEERKIVAGAQFEIGYSTQKPATDTLSLDEARRPRRDGNGRLLFRPGGHGALIENLGALDADLVFVKNIDNVQPARATSAMSHWARALGGYLLRLQSEVFSHLDELLKPEPGSQSIDAARRFLHEALHVDTADDGAPALISWLNRPLRVCGVVPNTGEPGGGPFWVRGADGRSSLQIVESSQVDPADEKQQVVLRSSTHFNPVHLVCAVRDRERRPFDLTRYIDHDAVIVGSKSEDGHELRALERPGLWNAAMAHWNTVFVEMPSESFAPVKTVVDLLRPEHQP